MVKTFGAGLLTVLAQLSFDRSANLTAKDVSHGRAGNCIGLCIQWIAQHELDFNLLVAGQGQSLGLFRVDQQVDDLHGFALPSASF